MLHIVTVALFFASSSIIWSNSFIGTSLLISALLLWAQAAGALGCLVVELRFSVYFTDYKRLIQCVVNHNNSEYFYFDYTYYGNKLLLRAQMNINFSVQIFSCIVLKQIFRINSFK